MSLSNISFQFCIYIAVYVNVGKMICLLLFSLQLSIQKEIMAQSGNHLYLQMARGSINPRVTYQQLYSMFPPKMSLHMSDKPPTQGPQQCQCFFSTFLIMKSMLNSTRTACIFSWQSRPTPICIWLFNWFSPLGRHDYGNRAEIFLGSMRLLIYFYSHCYVSYNTSLFHPKGRNCGYKGVWDEMFYYSLVRIINITYVNYSIV